MQQEAEEQAREAQATKNARLQAMTDDLARRAREAEERAASHTTKPVRVQEEAVRRARETENRLATQAAGLGRLQGEAALREPQDTEQLLSQGHERRLEPELRQGRDGEITGEVLDGLLSLMGNLWGVLMI